MIFRKNYEKKSIRKSIGIGIANTLKKSISRNIANTFE